MGGIVREGSDLHVLGGLARRAARRAYARYSGFAVGAALCDAEGRVFCGANVENAAYPLGICAERTALLAWREARGAPLRTIVIFTNTSVPTPPCGLCREALLRWAPEAEIYLQCADGSVGPIGTADTLPGHRPGGCGK